MGSVKVLSANIRSIYTGSHLLRNCRSLSLANSWSVQQPSGDRPASSSLLETESLLWQQKRHLFPMFPNPFRDGKRDGGKILKHAETHVVGYSMEQMFDIVAKVDQYKEFVPWCKDSVVTKHNRDSFVCKLAVGFPPVVERYTSRVTLSRPNVVKSICSDGLLFNHLETVWKFHEGIDSRPDTCTVDFFVEFQFRSALHSRLAQMFFDEVVRTMVKAFLKRAQKLYGPQSIKVSQQKKTVHYNPSDI